MPCPYRAAFGQNVSGQISSALPNDRAVENSSREPRLAVAERLGGGEV
jgi:hypothetical protein